MENKDQKGYTKKQCTENWSPENECMKTQDVSKQSPLRLLWIALGCMILKSLQKARGDRTVVLVSHRTSTMNLADVVVRMGAER